MLEIQFDIQDEKQIKALVNLTEKINEGTANDSDFRAWEILSHNISRRIAEKMSGLPWDE